MDRGERGLKIQDQKEKKDQSDESTDQGQSCEVHIPTSYLIQIQIQSREWVDNDACIVDCL